MLLELILLLVLALPLLVGLRILNEHERGVVFRLGRFHRIAGPGILWITPGTDRMARVDLPSVYPEWRSLSEADLEARLREGATSGEFRV